MIQDGDDNVASCWIWTGATTPGGYGVKRFGSTLKYVHRTAWEEHFGGIPEGLVLDHACRNRACANPYHLQVVTLAVNSRRRIGANMDTARLTLTHCVNGHSFTKANTYIGPKGWQGCRACRREAVARYNARRKVAA